MRIDFRFAQGKEGWDLAVTSAKKKVGMGQTIATILRDHIVYRKQIIKLAGSDLRRTYRASALGWAWAVIKPLVTIFVYWFAFSVGLRKGGDIAGYPFVLWLISGIVPWFYMSEMLTLGTECILRNRYLVTKMKYPVSTIPTFTSISKFFVHLILLVLTMLIFILTGHMPTVYMLQLPFYMLCNFLFFYGLGAVCRADRGDQHGLFESGQVVRHGGVLAFGHPVGGRLDARQACPPASDAEPGHVYLQRLPQLLHL